MACRQSNKNKRHAIPSSLGKREVCNSSYYDFSAGTPTSVLTTPLFFSKSARAFLNGVGVLGTFSSHTFTDGVWKSESLLIGVDGSHLTLGVHNWSVVSFERLTVGVWACVLVQTGVEVRASSVLVPPGLLKNWNRKHKSVLDKIIEDRTWGYSAVYSIHCMFGTWLPIQISLSVVIWFVFLWRASINILTIIKPLFCQAMSRIIFGVLLKTQFKNIVHGRHTPCNEI